ncbi:MAG TPA: PAS domain S-box protein [Blastocatellia bacterium]|nr:PAS domain S-box protein [Blastocatellia bacterium]
MNDHMPADERVNILIVDDRPSEILALQACLDPLGHNLVSASSGMEALRHVLTTDFAVILLDVNMPGLDGYETATVIRERDESRNTPILFVTATAMTSSEVMKGYVVGAVDYVLEPYTPEVLRWKVGVFVELHKARQRLKGQLRRSEEKYRDIFMNAVEGIFQSTPDGRLLEVNPALARILGYATPAELGAGAEGNVLRSYVHPQSREEFTRRLEAAGEVRGFETELRRKDGSVAWVAMSARAARSESGELLSYEGTLVDITERKLAEQALKHYGERLESLTHQLIQARENEQHRIARELHDEVGQVLTVVGFDLHGLQKTEGTPAFAERLEDCKRSVKRAIDQVRNLALDLRPTLLDDFGLGPALKWCATRAADRAGLALDLAIDELEQRFSGDLETIIYRVAQEALTNVMRHANATQLRVELHHRNAELQLVISDNGAGFDVAAAEERAARGLSLGLLGMEERVSLAGGQIEVESAPSHGTVVRVRFQLERAAHTLPGT